MSRTITSLVFIFLVTVSLLSSEVAAVYIKAARQPDPPPAQPLTSQQATEAQDRGWPRGFSLPSEAQVVVYQPQMASWNDRQHMVAFAAVSYVAKGEQKPALGTIKIEADTSTSLEKRLVKFSTLKITEANFQSLPKEQTREIVSEIEKSIPDEDRVISLDRVLVQVDKSQIVPKNVEGLKSDPPQIFLSRTPAILVAFDGDPIWSPIKDNELKFAVNTNWDVFQHEPTSLYYLRNEDTWFRATDIKGPWSYAPKLPDSFSKLPDDENWKDVKANVPGKPATKPAQVFVSTQPAELILIEGKPKFVPVPGTKLLWVSNTESDLFATGPDGPLYYLVAGRWFRAPNFNGIWTFATPTLPEDFRRISLEHPRSRVLASVPGTQQAAEAIVLASVPQIARVNKKEIKAPDVEYQGDPQYQAIEGTGLQRATNTDKEIIKVGDTYYICYQGVWFMANTPKGPWTLATSVPKEVYEIPPSSPAHSVTYVTIEKDDDDDDDWVTYAAAAGYTGMMIGWGCTMWGTGWYYPPYYYYGGYYPIYYPYWRTYGYGSWYNPYTGRYGTAGRIYGPYGGVGFGARYNPTTGTYSRGAFAYGPYGARGAAEAYNPRTGTYAKTRQGGGVYGSWGSTQVQRGDDWASTKRFTNRATGNTTRVTRGDQGGMISRRGEGGSGFVGQRGDNVYAGRDGNAYRRDQNGNWSKWENGGWNQVQRPEGDAVRDSMLNDRARDRERQNANRGQRDSARGERVSGSTRGQVDPSTYRNLERDRANRSEGARRSIDSGTYSRSSGSSRSAGSFRGGGFSRGGGGFRGGGGRRR
ncbi:MAG TPA: hypothetical protein VFH01_07370 [Pyrinomonadaceae bacterium]|nr:hypothetical protein [Pyrinomonadaceae bacterium]